MDNNFKSINLQYITTNITNKKNISCPHTINSKSIFPSGNKIVVYDNKFIVYDNNLNNVIQTNTSPHNAYIIYIDIYDENNFVTCSYDKLLKHGLKIIMNIQ